MQTFHEHLPLVSQSLISAKSSVLYILSSVFYVMFVSSRKAFTLMVREAMFVGERPVHLTGIRVS